tara:strand:- start:277 stop:888 length:612 start_codon:yes stop_codon:yes gene_type:complete
MNELIKASKKRVLIYFLLKDKLCPDLIQMVCDICDKNDLFFFYIRSKLLEEIKNNGSKEYIRCEPSIDEIKPSQNIVNFKKLSGNVYPVLYNHNDICGCNSCLCYYDNSRYITLLRQKNEPYRGENSKIVNNWTLFQYYLTTTKKWTRDIKGIDDIYGFTSIYDKNNNYKVNYNRYNTSHIILRNNKGFVIQIQNIWLKINNN